MRRFSSFFLVALAAIPLAAQEPNPNKLSVGVGTAAPTGSAALDSGVGLELNYGYRFTRYLQADVGFETSFNKDYRNYVPKFGTGLTTTTEYFVPAGGRVVIPLLNGRIEPSAGFGGVYAYDKGHSFHQNQGGVYGLGGVNYALDSRQKHRVGVTVRYMNLMSPGRPHPQWVNVFAEYTYSWGE